MWSFVKVDDCMDGVVFLVFFMDLELLFFCILMFSSIV